MNANDLNLDTLNEIELFARSLTEHGFHIQLVGLLMHVMGRTSSTSSL